MHPFKIEQNGFYKMFRKFLDSYTVLCILFNILCYISAQFYYSHKTFTTDRLMWINQSKTRM